MEAGFVQLGVFVLHGALGQVRFHADDRLDASGFGGAVEGHGAVHRAVVGKSDGGLVQLGGAGHQVVDSAQTIEQGVFAVAMEVDKLVMVFTHDGQFSLRFYPQITQMGADCAYIFFG